MTRVFEHRIKRILNHQTYNTETAVSLDNVSTPKGERV